MVRANEAAPITLDYGHPLTFGTEGSISRLPVTGFDLADGEHHSWTQRQTAELHFGLRLPSDSVELRVDAVPFLAPTVTSQQFFLYMNGLFLGFASLPERRTISFPVERSVISSRQNRLTFVVPTATRPSELGLGDDQRQLGIALISLTFAVGGV